MRKIGLALFACVAIAFAGCASTWNDIGARGGLIGSYEGSFVVISQSGGLVMDCWVLTDSYVESEENSDGWRFIDNDGNVVHIGGDSKVVRLDDEEDLKNYIEYHMEEESVTYREKFAQVKGGK